MVLSPAPSVELLQAVEACNLERCRALLLAGVDPNATSRRGCTPLMCAVMPDEFGDPFAPCSILQLVELLLTHGADPLLLDDGGMTAADHARRQLDDGWRDKFGVSAVSRWSDPEDIATLERIVARLDAS